MLILPQIDSNKLNEIVVFDIISWLVRSYVYSGSFDISSSLSCQSGFDLSEDKIQRPGDIPQTAFDSLKPEVDRLSPKKAYNTRKI